MFLIAVRNPLKTRDYLYELITMESTSVVVHYLAIVIVLLCLIGALLGKPAEHGVLLILHVLELMIIRNNGIRGEWMMYFLSMGTLKWRSSNCYKRVECKAIK